MGEFALYNWRNKLYWTGRSEHPESVLRLDAHRFPSLEAAEAYMAEADGRGAKWNGWVAVPVDGGTVIGPAGDGER